jgi:hypothetical protein
MLGRSAARLIPPNKMANQGLQRYCIFGEGRGAAGLTFPQPDATNLSQDFQVEERQ